MHILQIALLLVAMDKGTAQQLAFKTWGPDARLAVMDVYVGDVWGEQYCVGKQEYFLATYQPFGFGPVANPLAGQPRKLNGVPQPTWLGCGPDWDAAFLKAGVSTPKPF